MCVVGNDRFLYYYRKDVVLLRNGEKITIDCLKRATGLDMDRSNKKRDPFQARTNPGDQHIYQLSFPIKPPTSLSSILVLKKEAKLVTVEASKKGTAYRQSASYSFDEQTKASHFG